MFTAKAVIFDLDGVICFTDKYHYLAWKKLADRLGIYFDEQINNRLRGVSRMASLEIILERSEKEYTQEEKEAFAEEKNNDYREYLMTMSPADLSEEVKTTLDALRAKGYLLAIGSSSKNTKLILSKIGLGEYFDAIADGNDITHSKPDPEIYSRVLKLAGISPEDAIAVEDTSSGVTSAQGAGLYCFGFHNPGSGNQDLSHADKVIESLRELPGCFEAMIGEAL